MFLDIPNLLSGSVETEDNREEVDNLMVLMSSNMFKKQAIGYISGYVLKMITRFIKCSVCYDACLAQNNTSKFDVLHFLTKAKRTSADALQMC